ncbi:MAG: alpha/beta fold hydrolase [Spirochaetaceae bacterium]
MPTTTVNGISIHYEHRPAPTDDHNAAPPRGETVALLNGVMASTSSWEYYADILTAAGYDVLMHDFRGQLLSEKPEGPYTFAGHRDDFLELCRSLEIGPCHLVGTSYGGEVAMRIAIDSPGAVKSLVIIDSVSELDALAERFVQSWIALAETGDTSLFYASVLPSLYSRSFLRDQAAMIDGRAERMKGLPPDYLRGQIELYRAFLKDVTMTSELPKIAAPALVACGREDILKPVRFSEIIARQIPTSELVVIPDCGHVAVFEKPETLATVILGFLQRHA